MLKIIQIAYIKFFSYNYEALIIQVIMAKTNDNFFPFFLLQQLESIASQLGIEVRYENLADEELTLHGGICKLFKRPLIVIDSRLPIGQRAKLLAQEIGKYDLENFYILPRVREFISLHSSAFEKNLPHK